MREELNKVGLNPTTTAKVPNNEAPDVCSQCGGKCCTMLGGGINPLEIGDVTRERIIELLNTGFVAIDWYEGDVYTNKGVKSPYDTEFKRMYFLRMRHKNAGAVDPAFCGVCKLHTKDGCILSFDQRPYGCRSLYPIKTEDNETICVGAYEKAQMAIDWAPYYSIFEDILNSNDNEYTLPILDVFSDILSAFKEEGWV